MLICDTGPLIAALDPRDGNHEACAALLDQFAGRVHVPAPVVTEAAIFLLGRYGARPHQRFLDAVAAEELEVVNLEADDHRRVAALCRAYADLPLDQVDASVVAVAERYRQTRVASIDHRHFTIVRLANGGTLELLPGRAA